MIPSDCARVPLKVSDRLAVAASLSQQPYRALPSVSGAPPRCAFLGSSDVLVL